MVVLAFAAMTRGRGVTDRACERRVSGTDVTMLSIFETSEQQSYFSSEINFSFSFYRAMHLSAKRGIAIACRLSVRPSVCDVGEL